MRWKNTADSTLQIVCTAAVEGWLPRRAAAGRSVPLILSIYKQLSVLPGAFCQAHGPSSSVKQNNNQTAATALSTTMHEPRVPVRMRAFRFLSKGH